MLKLKQSLGHRIARLVAVATFAAVFSAATAQTLFQATKELEQRAASLQATAFALASAAGDAVALSDRTKASAALTAVSRIPDILMASIQLPDGTTLASMGQGALLASDLLTKTDSKLAMLFKGHLPIAVDIIKGGERRGELVMLADISSVRQQVLVTMLTTFAAALLAALLGMMASRPLQKRIVGPLTRMTQTIQAIRSSRNYATNLAGDQSQDETGILVRAFNGLMADIRFRDDALQKLAYHDPLTGLPNRVSFQRSLDEWITRPLNDVSAAVVLMNIHSFRAMNDAFSHSIGDAILMTVAASIKATIREGATLARYGGDEFALLLPGISRETEVEMVIARINSSFFKPLQIGDLELHITLTAGATLLLADDQRTARSDDILRQTDLALAEAKKQVAGRVQFFRPEFSRQVQEDTELGQALRNAAKAGAFNLVYQPQLDLQSGQISGFEALIRWTHPVRGPVSPAVFIPIAERIGLVSIIGDWVLNEGCRQAAQWYRQGRGNWVTSVNVSPAQILAAGFVEKVRSALRKSGLPPHLLCIELTESIFVGGNYAETAIILETLANDGVRLALDDFGTGYSSLGYLSKLPFHVIKVDRSFVSLADKDERKQGMLRSIIEMVHALGMAVVAEGAETASEVGLLQTLRVEKVQGYAVARPLPAAEAMARAIEIEARTKLLSA